jgi:hypothetical protein
MIVVKDKSCNSDGCKGKYHARGYCAYHYQLLWKNKLIETRNEFMKDHPLYSRWAKMKASKLLCEEWLDFKKFAENVGEKPEGSTKLQRLDDTKLYAQDNFQSSKPLEGDRKNEYYRNYWKTSRNYRNQKYVKTYGITLDEYEIMLKEQDYKCAICRREETRVVRNGSDEAKRMLAVDHCHETGKVRGLLCSDCNPSLGGFQDSIEILANAIAYLNKYQS